MEQENGSSKCRPATAFENSLSAGTHYKWAANLFLFKGIVYAAYGLVLLEHVFLLAKLVENWVGKSTQFHLGSWVYQ